MKGISYITDNKNRRKAVVIDYRLLKKSESEIEDLMDLLIAESRVEEPSVAYEHVIKSLRKKRKL